MNNKKGVLKMGLLNHLKSKKKDEIVLLNLNARLQPMHRGEIFEDMFEEILSKYDIGEVIGGGTLQMPTGEIKCCDIEFSIHSDCLDKFISFIQKVTIIPKGSKLTIDNKEIEIGCAEGLALYLNGTDLPKEVYENSDINECIQLLDNALEGIAQRLSHWEGSKETALYFYGNDFEEMKEKVISITKTYPLCEKCRIEQIA